MTVGLIRAGIMLLDLTGRRPALAARTSVGRRIHVFLQDALKQPGHHPVVSDRLLGQYRLLPRIDQTLGLLFQPAGGVIEPLDPAEDLDIRRRWGEFPFQKALGVVTGTLGSWSLSSASSSAVGIRQRRVERSGQKFSRRNRSSWVDRSPVSRTVAFIQWGRSSPIRIGVLARAWRSQRWRWSRPG